MKDYNAQKVIAWKEHHDRFTCDHPTGAVCKRQISGGSFQYVAQCTRCGKPMCSPMPKSEALAICGGREPQPFDDDLREQWDRTQSEAAAEINARFDRTAFFAQYSEYLNSSAWAARRKAVLRGASGQCEGCAERAATQVHHLTYEHVGAELLFELVAVCDECHERIHQEPT